MWLDNYVECVFFLQWHALFCNICSSFLCNSITFLQHLPCPFNWSWEFPNHNTLFERKGGGPGNSLTKGGYCSRTFLVQGLLNSTWYLFECLWNKKFSLSWLKQLKTSIPKVSWRIKDQRASFLLKTPELLFVFLISYIAVLLISMWFFLKCRDANINLNSHHSPNRQLHRWIWSKVLWKLSNTVTSPIVENATDYK